MSSLPPKKGDIIINPNTQRPVRVGSRTWINLVKKGSLSGKFTDDNIIEEKYEELPEDQFEERIKKINEKLPVGTQAVRGRGKYANKIVRRNKPLSQEEITKSTVKKASRAVINNIDELDEIDYDEMEKQLEKLIMEEMLNTRPNKNKKSKPIPIQKQKKQQSFEEDEDFEDEGDLEFNENDY
jgi:hypothetical protein